MTKENKIFVELKYHFRLILPNKSLSTFFLSRFIGMDVLPPLHSTMYVDIGYHFNKQNTTVTKITTTVGKGPYDQEFKIYLTDNYVTEPITFENFQLGFVVSTIEEYEEKVKTLGWMVWYLSSD